VKVTKDQTIAEVLEKTPKTAEVFFSHGMACLGCAVARGETLAEAAEVHGIEIDALLSELNEVVEQS
jgi:hybrid cluster-associated redox disulfide protein